MDTSTLGWVNIIQLGLRNSVGLGGYPKHIDKLILKFGPAILVDVRVSNILHGRLRFVKIDFG